MSNDFEEDTINKPKRNPTLREIEKAFKSEKDPLLALSLCDKANVPSGKMAEFDLLYAEILRWCNRPSSALDRIDHSIKLSGDQHHAVRCLLQKGLVFDDLFKSTSAVGILEQALLKAIKETDAGLKIRVQAALGFAHSNAGSQEMAAMHLQEALNQARTHKMLNLMPTLYSYKALCEFRNRNYELSKAEAEKGIGKKYADINGAAECYRTLGLIHSTVGEYMLAVENHQMALMIFRKLHHVPNLTRQYIDLGTSYLNMSEIDMAEHFFKKAITCAEGGENLPLVGFAYSRLGTMHLAQGHYDESLRCFVKGKDLSLGIENLSVTAHINRNTGRCLFHTGDFKAATKSLEKAIDQFARSGDRLYELLSRYDLALAGLLAFSSTGQTISAAKRKVYEIPGVNAELIRGHPSLEGRQLFVSGCLDAVAGQWEPAEESINRAMHIMEKHLFYTEQAEMMFIFGRIALDQTRRPQGISLLQRALRIAETYYLQGMAKKIIDKLDKLEEVTLVTYSLEKQASRVSGEDYVVESLSSEGEEEIVGSSFTLKAALKTAKEAAWTDLTVLLIGETGTGKELLARNIHCWSERSGKKFVAVNCGAIPKELVESILFGHMKGAFTGAVQHQKGSIRSADSGTIFLDEITELPVFSQVKLLRFLENKEIQPLGAGEAVKVDVRVIASTNRDPIEAMRSGILREDLYYRLSILPISLPNLKDRQNDAAEIARYFISTLPIAKQKKVQSITRAAEAWILKQPWPGNVRELYNIIVRAVVSSRGSSLTIDDLESYKGQDTSSISHFIKLDDVIRNHIMQALKRCNGNQVQAAKLLGIHRNTLRNKLNTIMK